MYGFSKAWPAGGDAGCGPPGRLGRLAGLIRAVLLALMACAALAAGLAFNPPPAAAQRAAATMPAAAPAANPVAQRALADGLAYYRLNPGDEVEVRFPLNPELDTIAAIGPDGRFTLPLLGRVRLGGLSLDEAEAEINRALREASIVADARASLSVGTYSGMVYVGGEVAKPGAVALINALNPLQAIIEAGGMSPTARTSRVAVIRATAEGGAVVYPVNVRRFIRAGASAQADGGGMRLQPGDIVFVPRSGIAEVNLFIEQYVNGLVPDAFNIFFNLNAGGGGGVTVAPPAN